MSRSLGYFLNPTRLLMSTNISWQPCVNHVNGKYVCMLHYCFRLLTHILRTIIQLTLALEAGFKAVMNCPGSQYEYKWTSFYLFLTASLRNWFGGPPFLIWYSTSRSDCYIMQNLVGIILMQENRVHVASTAISLFSAVVVESTAVVSVAFTLMVCDIPEFWIYYYIVVNRSWWCWQQEECQKCVVKH